MLLIDRGTDKSHSGLRVILIFDTHYQVISNYSKCRDSQEPYSSELRYA